MIKKQVGQLIGKFKLLKVSKFQKLKFTDLQITYILDKTQLEAKANCFIYKKDFL